MIHQPAVALLASGRKAQNAPKGQRGMTLIELLLTITIAATVLFGLFVLVNKIQSANLASQEAQNLNIMVADTRAKFRSQGNFNNISPQVLIQNNVPPENMVDAAGNQIISGWNTPITVQSSNLPGLPAGSAVEFGYQNVPSEDCSAFVQNAEGAFARVEVAGNPVKQQGGTLDVALLGQACDSGATVAVNFIQGR